MRNLKNIFAAAALMSVLTLGTTIASAGIIIRGRSDDDGDDLSQRGASTCTVEKRTEGIIIRGFTGIIIRGLTGIIIRGFGDDVKTCSK